MKGELEMKTSNYNRTRITLNDYDQKILGEVIDLLNNMWSAAPENTDLEKEIYDTYAALSNLRIKAIPDSKGNLYWEEEIEIKE